ncbi:uncharacterized protein LOC124205383 [Daphnia pulex]|uniref:uncharacterized protein LOC124205383 n=1 Tax=Daphnia pulex TaxID=6669 RepID=UPI001EDD9D5E|nr:uncharacterized protein LOC124205383 [Daphnia pulex]
MITDDLLPPGAIRPETNDISNKTMGPPILSEAGRGTCVFPVEGVAAQQKVKSRTKGDCSARIPPTTISGCQCEMHLCKKMTSSSAANRPLVYLYSDSAKFHIGAIGDPCYRSCSATEGF